MKKDNKKPACPKCQKRMRLLSTGMIGRVWTFYCADCKQTKLVEQKRRSKRCLVLNTRI
jgi:ssDNA-binding Zn-finger/Zn-ribbon topoisomerase 1